MKKNHESRFSWTTPFG